MNKGGTTMRVRKITLVVLFALTILAGLDIRYGDSSADSNGIIQMRINTVQMPDWPEYTGTQTLTLAASDMSQFVVYHKFGAINYHGADTDQITVVAKITVEAETEEEAQAYAEQLSIQLIQAGDVAELQFVEPERPKNIQSVTVAYEIIAPYELAVVVNAEYSDITLSDLLGTVRMAARFCTVKAKNLTGSVDGDFDFTNVELKQFSGSLNSDNNFSNMSLDLNDKTSGYTIAVSVKFGTLNGNVKLDQNTEQNLLNATGIIGDGRNNISITANFSNVQINRR